MDVWHYYYSNQKKTVNSITRLNTETRHTHRTKSLPGHATPSSLHWYINSMLYRVLHGTGRISMCFWTIIANVTKSQLSPKQMRKLSVVWFCVFRWDSSCKRNKRRCELTNACRVPSAMLSCWVLAVCWTSTLPVAGRRTSARGVRPASAAATAARSWRTSPTSLTDSGSVVTRTVRWQTNWRSVKSRTGQLSNRWNAWIWSGLHNRTKCDFQ